MVQHVFRAKIWERSPNDPGSWHFLTLPAELSEDITLEAGPRKGFGSVRVEVSIESTTWHTSLFPDAAAGTLVLPVKKQVRQAEGLRAGPRLWLGSTLPLRLPGALARDTGRLAGPIALAQD